MGLLKLYLASIGDWDARARRLLLGGSIDVTLADTNCKHGSAEAEQPRQSRMLLYLVIHPHANAVLMHHSKPELRRCNTGCRTSQYQLYTQQMLHKCIIWCNCDDGTIGIFRKYDKKQLPL